MAIIKMYVDFWPGLNPVINGITAYSQPMAKLSNNRRFSFDIEIPDNVINEVEAEFDPATEVKLEDDK